MRTINTIKRLPIHFFAKGILFFVSVLAAFSLFAQQTIEISGQSLPFSIGNQVSILKDNKEQYNSYTIARQTAFVNNNKPVPTLTSARNNVWVRFTIQNKSPDSELYLSINYADISLIRMYRQAPGAALQLIYESGNRYAFSKRADDNVNFNIPLLLAKGETSTFYLNVNSAHPYDLPLFINNPPTISQSVFKENIIISLFCGIILSTILYNLFLLFATRDKNYLVYVGYLFTLCLAQITFAGWSFKFLWPNHPELNSFITICTSCIGGIMGIFFGKYFLNTAYYTPKLNRLLSALMVCYTVAVIASFTRFSGVSYMAFNYTGIVASATLFAASVIIYRKGFRTALFYLIAWSAFLSGFIIYLLKNLDIVPYNDLTHFIVYIGSSIEVVLLSFALANKINILREEKDVSQANALRIAKENEQLIQEQNVMLEKQVAERTYDLEKTLRELKDAQIQLVESEKMASLGQLTAGIAHEINNPINFVKSNVSPLQMDVQDLFELIAEYQKLHSTSAEIQPDMLKKIRVLENKLDPDFLKEEIESLIGGIEEGAERTAEIVRGLRNFSRLDESETKEVNVYENINSTLVLLRNNMPNYIKIRKHFEARAEIECYPGKLNQVFMNILTNSIHAIKTKPEKNAEEYIDIFTSEAGDYMQIRIADTGIGMTDEVKHKIFEPFFTTKDVGEGTGLGMAIVFKIIEKHNGKISVQSSFGEGATFVIDIPYVLRSATAFAENEVSEIEQADL